MNERDFLKLAAILARGSTEAEWRASLGRAYYAAFHVARQLLEELSFVVPRADRAHTYLSYRLQNSGAASIERAGMDLQELRQRRNQADYDLHLPVARGMAASHVLTAEQVIQRLDAARSEPIRSQITDAMRIYERTVLGVVTWRVP
jgi:uncharacterized protein (UPF0332 family)